MGSNMAKEFISYLLDNEKKVNGKKGKELNG
jgi:hypothetical protein